MAGRKNKPQSLRKLTGQKASSPPVPPDELAQPRLAEEVPPPEGMGEIAAGYWTKNLEMVVRLGILSEADYGSFVMLCEGYEEWRQTHNDWQEFLSTKPPYGGLMIQGASGGWVSNPQIAAKQKAKLDFLKLMMEFGMTPASRARVGVVGGKKKGTDEFDI